MLIAKSYYGREAHQGIQRLSEGMTPIVAHRLGRSVQVAMRARQCSTECCQPDTRLDSLGWL